MNLLRIGALLVIGGVAAAAVTPPQKPVGIYFQTTRRAG